MPFRMPSIGPVTRSVIGFAVVAVIFVFLARSLAGNWSDLRSQEIDVQPALIVAAAALLAGDLVVRALAWAQLLAHYEGDRRPSLAGLTKAFVYSWLGRYVPGKVPSMLGRYYLGRTLGVPGRSLLGSLAYENVLIALTALALASLTLIPSLAAISETYLVYLFLPPVVALGALAIQPAVLRRALELVLRLLGREFAHERYLLPPRRLAAVAVTYLVAFCLSGVGFYFLIAAVTPYPVRYLPLAVGTFTLAGVVGMVSLFTPAGLGVREGFIVGILQFTMPVELAILVSFVARAWAIGVDLLAVSICAALDHASGERLLATTVLGTGRAVDDAPGAVGTPRGG